MEKFTFDLGVKGYHVYKDVWKLSIGEKLHAEQELHNNVNKICARMVKEKVGHLHPKYSRILWYFIALME